MLLDGRPVRTPARRPAGRADRRRWRRRSRRSGRAQPEQIDTQGDAPDPAGDDRGRPHAGAARRCHRGGRGLRRHRSALLPGGQPRRPRRAAGGGLAALARLGRAALRCQAAAGRGRDADQPGRRGASRPAGGGRPARRLAPGRAARRHHGDRLAGARARDRALRNSPPIGRSRWPSSTSCTRSSSGARTPSSRRAMPGCGRTSWRRSASWSFSPSRRRPRAPDRRGRPGSLPPCLRPD